MDQQIVAIAKVEGVKTIYTDDPDVKRFAKRVNIESLGLADLPLSPEDKQARLFDNEATEEGSGQETS